MRPRVKKPFFSNNNPSAVPPPKANTRSLPDADALLQVSSFLNQTDFSRTRQALSGFQGLYNAKAFHKISAAGQLLKATEYADYTWAEQLIIDNPSLMFEPVSFTFRDGREERISPLRYAFKVLDTYMWKTVFLKRIEEIEDPVKREEYREKFVAQMQAQAEEKEGHVDLEPLFQAYEEYGEQSQRFFAQEISQEELDHEWYKLGEKQKMFLPVHMLKEFSCKSETWKNDASFDVDQIPRPSNCQIQNSRVKKSSQPLFSLSSILSDSGWGTSFALIRGPLARLSSMRKHASPITGADLAIFRRLFKVRSDDFTTQLSLMLQNARENQEQQNQSRTWRL